MKKRTWISIAITITTVGFLFTLFDPREILDSLWSMDPSFMVLAVLTHALTYYFRSKTFSLLIPNRSISAGDIFWIHCTHNFLNMVLPARTGEVSYIVLLKTRHDVSSTQALSSLLMTRLFDLAAIPVFFVLGLILWGDITIADESTSVYWKIGSALVLFVFLTVVLLTLPRVNELFWRAFGFLFGLFGVRSNNKVRKLLQKGEELTYSLQSVGKPIILLKAGTWAMFSRLANFLIIQPII